MLYNLPPDQKHKNPHRHQQFISISISIIYSQLLSVCGSRVLNQVNRTKASSAQTLQDVVSLSNQTAATARGRSLT